MATAMRRITVSALIPVDPDELFAFVSDTRKDPLWCPNVETVDQLAGEGVEVGARFRFHQHLDRPRQERMQFDVDVEVVDLGGRSITWKARDRFQERTITLSVEPHQEGSKITQVTTATFLRPPGLARWVYPTLARRIFRDQFERLAGYFADEP
jgi:Polyketide cyclase / dehydrase and lipid transport